MPPVIPATSGNLPWRIARKCDAGNCVRVAPHAGMIVIGDTMSPDGPVLAYSHDKWKAFVEGVRQGNFDDLA
jgi:predicted secreted Zn-dependent protease